MKKIILHSFICAGLIVFAGSCSKDVKAPMKATNATNTNKTTTTTTTTTTTDHTGGCGGDHTYTGYNGGGG